MGVLVFKGMQVGFLEGDLTIGVDKEGAITSTAILSTSYNVVPLWLRVAHDNLALSKTAFQAISDRWDADPENQKAMLIAELTPSIQTMVACAITYDALYDQLKPLAKLTENEIAAWKKNKTSRASQISEVFRRVYGLNNGENQAVKKVIAETIKWRDLAVHPSHGLKNAVNRPDIPVGLDWRFCAYRYENAAICYDNSIKLLTYFRDKRSSDKAADTNMENIFEVLKEMELVPNER